MLKQPSQCTDLKPFHRLIKGKFMEILNVAFSSILTNREFYFYRGQFFNKVDIKRDMFDDLSVPLSRIPEFVLDKYDSEDSEQQTFTPMEVGDGGHSVHANTPLFLHLVCTIQYPGAVSNTSVKVLPTCFGKELYTLDSSFPRENNVFVGELIDNLGNCLESFIKSDLQITLGIMCLTLPIEIQNVIANYNSKAMRATSFCSDRQMSHESATSEYRCLHVQVPT